VDTPANKRWCHKERHGEEEEVADAMAMTEDDAAGIGSVAAGWEDEYNKTKWRTTWDSKSWGCQSRKGSGPTRGRIGW
jgi:hypothetical protein